MLTRLIKPDIGVITNIGPAHMEFFGSLDLIMNAKAEILANMESGAVAVLNADDGYFQKLHDRARGKVLTFGIEHRADVSATGVRQEKDVTDFVITSGGSSVRVRIQAVGRHNVYNALAAAAAAIAMELPLDSVKFGLEDFSPPSMRSELLEIKGRLILKDCYNANPRSMEAALDTLVSLRQGGAVIAVLGDMLELGTSAPDAHRAIGATAARLGVDLLITVGTLSKFIGEGAVAAGLPADRVIMAESNAEAAALLTSRSRIRDAILIKGSRAMKMEKILEDF
jgi:UDP-N-acetylmuramoyl-tripeptide--D-alanyl-D-alanine ligase